MPQLIGRPLGNFQPFANTLDGVAVGSDIIAFCIFTVGLGQTSALSRARGIAVFPRLFGVAFLPILPARSNSSLHAVRDKVFKTACPCGPMAIIRCLSHGVRSSGHVGHTSRLGQIDLYRWAVLSKSLLASHLKAAANEPCRKTRFLSVKPIWYSGENSRQIRSPVCLPTGLFLTM